MVQLVALGGFFILGVLVKEKYDKIKEGFANSGTDSKEITLLPPTSNKTQDPSSFASMPTVTYPCLIGISGIYTGRAFRFRSDRPTVTIGRDPSSDFPVPDDITASRLHAVIRISAEGFTVRDTGSTNGTRVNGAPIKGEVILHIYDKLTVGSNVFQLDVVTGIP